MQNKQKLTYGIKGKLISATAMLLVALIMVVSSSYAWFTLSTAPEVTGINTAVGANGALEMALLQSNADGAMADVLSGQVSGNDPNFYWGNLVDFDKNTNGGFDYGVNNIVLYPSVLNAADGIIGANGGMLQYPVYGADGRVSGLESNSVTGTFVEAGGTGNFYPNNGLGFRAVGSASGMSERQLAYRTAKAAASTATALASKTAAASLNQNGGMLANIVVKKAMNTSEKYTNADVAALQTIVNDLLGYDTTTGSEPVHTTGALEYIEEAYLNYIRMYAAGTAGTYNDTVWSVVDSALADEDLFNVVVISGDTVSINIAEYPATLPDGLAAPIIALKNTIEKVETADTALDSLTDDNHSWEDLNGALQHLANIGAMKVNGFTASEATQGDNLSTLVSDIMSNGANVTIASGGGVYADIADHCGSYEASVIIEELRATDTLVVKNFNAKMTASTTLGAAYLPVLGATVSSVSGAPSSAVGQDTPITEFYGYIIDLAFRTNAKESDLLLQTDPIDRIYEDNTNEETMGGGSSMTFNSISDNFTEEQLRALMGNIRIVFFDTLTKNILANARLNMATATSGVDGVTAKMYMYSEGTTTYKTDASGNYVDASNNVLYYKVNGAYYAKADCTVTDGVASANEGATAVAVENMTGLVPVEAGTFLEGQAAVITSLQQNAQHNVSVLVYLDGETITNADVAYDVAESMTGTMNLQFSSSATLVPMEYADIHIPGGNN